MLANGNSIHEAFINTVQKCTIKIMHCGVIIRNISCCIIVGEVITNVWNTAAVANRGAQSESSTTLPPVSKGDGEPGDTEMTAVVSASTFLPGAGRPTEGDLSPLLGGRERDDGKVEEGDPAEATCKGTRSPCVLGGSMDP